MSRLPALAARNVGRNGRRSLITGAAITVAVIMVMLLKGFVSGAAGLMVADVVEGRSGAIQVHKKGYVDSIESVPTRLNIPYTPELIAKIQAVPNVKGVTGRIVFNGLVGNGSTQTMFIGRAIDLERETQACPRAKSTVRAGGEPLSPGDGAHVLIGYELSESFGWAVPPPLPPTDALLTTSAAQRGALVAGSIAEWQAKASAKRHTVSVQSTSPAGRSNAIDLEVKGYSVSSMPFENKRVLTVPLATAQALIDLDGRVTEYAIGVEDLGHLEETKLALQAALGPEFEVHSWHELNTFVRDVINRQNIVFSAISMVLFIIALTVIANTMLMSVFERVREIGTLLAVGVRRRQVLQLFIIEAAVIGLIGGVIGAAVGRFALFVIATIGIPIEMPGTSGHALLQPSVTLPFVIGAVIAAMFGALAASALPARRASRLNPVDALRNA
ncbi:MAG: ABC transporter permease [Myxococcaceae bacterium]|nr:ABC transporter permease [Myxococcaceae bacterium]